MEYPHEQKLNYPKLFHYLLPEQIFLQNKLIFWVTTIYYVFTHSVRVAYLGEKNFNL